MGTFDYQAARRIFGIANDAPFRRPAMYPTRQGSQGGILLVLPRMMEAAYARPATMGLLDDEVKETLWTAIQLTSRATYRWLTGKTQAMDQGGYARSFLRRGQALPADRPDYRLP